MTKPTLQALLASNPDRKLLFLGREGGFTREEIAHFLKRFTLSVVESYSEGVVAIIEHHALNPLDEQLSDQLYAQGVPSYPLRVFERLLSEQINDDELLMGIKLSNDQARIHRLLGNGDLSDSLFVKLLRLYEWGDSEEDRREDRDVIIHTLRRYIAIRPNEEDILHSYLTLRQLASEATDSALLMALMGFPNFEFVVRGRAKVTLQETIAQNPAIDAVLVQQLVRRSSVAIDTALAGNRAVALEVLRGLAKKHHPAIDEALAINPALDTALFERLLGREEQTQALLLVRQPIDSERLASVELAGIEAELFGLMGANEQLSEAVVERLLEQENPTLLCHLGGNRLLSTAQLESLYLRRVAGSAVTLATNPNLSPQRLEELYEQGEEAVAVALASNPALPQGLLRRLFEQESLAINQALASNPALPQ